MKQYRLVDIFFLLVTFLLKMREYFEEKFLVGHIWKWNGQEKSLDFVKNFKNFYLARQTQLRKRDTKCSMFKLFV